MQPASSCTGTAISAIASKEERHIYPLREDNANSHLRDASTRNLKRSLLRGQRFPRLNQCAIPRRGSDREPLHLPTVAELILNQANSIRKLQLDIAIAPRRKTAFQLRGGLYRNTRLPRLVHRCHWMGYNRGASFRACHGDTIWLPCSLDSRTFRSGAFQNLLLLLGHPAPLVVPSSNEKDWIPRAAKPVSADLSK